MASINGVKKSSAKKKVKNNEGEDSAVAKILLAVAITALATLLIIIGVWKLFLEKKVALIYTQAATSECSMVYKSSSELNLGDDIASAVKLVPVPKNLVSSTTLDNASSLDGLKAARPIRENEIITSDNTYSPETEDIVLSTSRQVSIDYLDTPGVQAGDYIDIRFKVYKSNSLSTYRDEIVCAKKEVLSKTDDTVILMLSESEILNLNNAVVEAAINSKDSAAELYTTKYVDVKNQPKATVTYNGKGMSYTEQELAEAQQRLKDIQQGIPEYVASEVVVEPEVIEQ